MAGFLTTARRRAPRASALWLAAALSAVAGTAEAETNLFDTEHRYKFAVNWSMFPELTLATGEINLRSRDDAYEVVIDASAKLAGTPVNWKGAFSTAGALVADNWRPQLFKRVSIRRPGDSDEQRTDATVAWAEDGPPKTEIVRTPDRPAAERPEVDIEQAGAVVDPLTFMVQMLDRVVRTDGEDCGTLSTTWDGERLAVIETVTADRVAKARIDCRVTYRAILGLTGQNRFRVREEDTLRIIRFRKVGGRWRPEFLKIEAVLTSGLRTTFTTTLTPLGSGG